MTKWIEIAYPYDLQNTHGISISPQILKECVRNFYKLKLKYIERGADFPGIPLNINHQTQGFIPVGWIIDLQLREGNTLWGKIEDDSIIQKMIDQNITKPSLYSAEFQEVEGEGWYLVSVAVLVGKMPALPALRELAVQRLFLKKKNINRRFYYMNRFNLEADWQIQTIIFDKSKFTQEEAEQWLKDNGFQNNGVDETEDSYRYRQEDPELFDEMRTIDITEGVKAVYGRLKKVTEMKETINAMQRAIAIAENAKNEIEELLKTKNELMQKAESEISTLTQKISELQNEKKRMELEKKYTKYERKVTPANMKQLIELAQILSEEQRNKLEDLISNLPDAYSTERINIKPTNTNPENPQVERILRAYKTYIGGK